MGFTLPSAGPRMQSPAVKEAGRGGPRERTGKGSREERAKGPPAAEPPKPGWALSLEGLAAMRPPQRHRHLLFGDLLEDVGVAASIFPRESVELGYHMPDPRAWTQSLELPAVRQDMLLGVLKAAEARGRIRALRLRYIRMRAEEISLLILQQKSARAAIRLELFLPPQLKPTRIPDPLDRQENCVWSLESAAALGGRMTASPDSPGPQHSVSRGCTDHLEPFHLFGKCISHSITSLSLHFLIFKIEILRVSPEL
uniref:Protein LKAAEAR1 isoform X1 n=1 Tax=Callorhinus ursinus TaxID=34884 RepID=A0A3Q7PXM3_CALUR|nr:protein LKAAEAR1 isoform X1 [Callorhinus ursinus]